MYGTTNNPYNVDYMVGGTSGGEAQLPVQCLASEVTLVEVFISHVFSDVFSHKHSPYLTPDGSKFPLTSSDAKCLLARSPMC